MCGFRGSIAPASLKPLNLVASDEGPRTFPGLYCPGLIEAGGSHCLPLAFDWFPGLYCPGLIEAILARGGRAMKPEFPGLYCPGLIEA